MKLNLGSGKNQIDGYLSIDIADFGNNMVWDVSRGLPFEDDSIDEIYSSHFFEHVDDLIWLMNEVWRVLKSDGVCKFVVPHMDNPRAFVPNHKHFFNEESIRFFGRTDIPEMKIWKITDLDKNNRPDLHVVMKPLGKEKPKYEKEKLYRLELGCGKNTAKTFIGIDMHPEYGDVKRDLSKQCIPFGEGSVSKIRAMSFIEHLEDTESIMNECWRVLHKGGILEMSVPDYQYGAAYADPTHKSFFSLGTFKYFTRERPRYAQYNFKRWKINKLSLKEGIIYAELQKEEA